MKDMLITAFGILLLFGLLFTCVGFYVQDAFYHDANINCGCTLLFACLGIAIVYGIVYGGEK